MKIEFSFLLLMFLVAVLPFLDGGMSLLGNLFLYCLPIFLVTLLFLEKKCFRLDLPIFLTFFAFLFFAGLSTINSLNLSFSTLEFFRLLSYFLIFFVAYQVIKDHQQIKILSYLVIIVGFLLSLLSFYFLLPQVPKPTSPLNLVYATYGHNHLSDWLIFVLPIVFAKLLVAKGKKAIIFWAPLTLFFFVSFLLTFCRGAFLFLPLVGILLLKLFPKRVEKWKQFFVYSLIFTPLILCLLIFIFSITPYGQQLNQKQINGWFLKQVIKPASQEQRIALWQQALKIWQTSPIIGTGPDTFRLGSLKYQERQASWSLYAHNYFLQILTDTGILGFLSFVSFIFFLFKKAKEKVDSPDELGLFLSSIYSFLHSLIDFDWQFPAIFLIFWVFMAFLASKEAKDYHKKIILSFLALSILVFLFGLRFLLGEYFLLKKDYQKSLTIFPFAKANWQFWLEEIFEKDQNKVQQVVSQALLFNQNDAKFYQFLAKNFEKIGQEEGATKYYWQSLNFDPFDQESVFGFYKIASAQEKKAKIFHALEAFEKANGEWCNIKCGLWEEQRKKFAQLLQIEKDKKLMESLTNLQKGKVYFWLSILNVDLNDWESQKEWLEKALKFDPGNKEYQQFLDDTKLLLVEDYYSLASRIEKRDPKKIRLYRQPYYGFVFYALGERALRENTNQAIGFFQKAVEFNPWHEGYYLKLAQGYKGRGELEKANEIIDDCLLKTEGKWCKKEL